jgi:hypothetical protein
LAQFKLVPSRVYSFQIVSTYLFLQNPFVYVTPRGVNPLTLPTLRVLLFSCTIVHDDVLSLSDVVVKMSLSFAVNVVLYHHYPVRSTIHKEGKLLAYPGERC